ncbi:MAG: hypothetical protein J6R42_05365 [Clostridia bacterium]|nr:hypothetical protein [Clostridia bacterium]
MKKTLLFICGFLGGVLYVLLGFVGPFVLVASCFVSQNAGKTPNIWLGALCLASIVGFFFLTKLFRDRWHCSKFAFPLGVFLAADMLLLSIPLFNLLDSKKLLLLVGGNEYKWLADAYIRLVAELIVLLTLLVVVWMISLLLGQFKKFRRLAELLEAQQAQVQALEQKAELPAVEEMPSPADDVAKNVPSPIDDAEDTPKA